MLGLLCAQLVGGALVARFGSRPLVLAGALTCAAALIPVSLAATFAALAGCFLLVGLSNGVLDVSMNVHGLAVERRLGRPILATLHAGFSFGALAGAGIGGLVAAAGVGVRAAPGRRVGRGCGGGAHRLPASCCRATWTPRPRGRWWPGPPGRWRPSGCSRSAWCSPRGR